jgi:formate hydrogenlyase subunit 3/multisubunit Na+/H+ antiporter MnhD subunit
MVLFIVFFPVLAALANVWLGKRSEHLRDGCVVLSTALVLAAMIAAALTQSGTVVTVPICHLTFTLDGFRCVYGLVVCFMWFVSALLSPQYFLHHHNLSRYYFFFLLTLSSTAGVFLSADLYTTFLFFEMMSFGSYVWVIQEETPGALDAGKTYLTIAVLGGLVTLMGLFILNHLTGTLVISELKEACAAVENRSALWGAAVCILVGFGAKAGMFPLHIWLPKAHPVAPAPASALLSGILTKAGLFGVLVITAQILPEDPSWGTLILILGAITMVLGAVIAVFSNNLKYILACSSLSQIGFILVGISMICLLGEENALAANGTVLYMMNHSLVKLTLFLFAGVVYLNTHALDLNRIRGFGRDKPVLQALFLMGACSLAGIPGFCGYLSKTLVHESIVEYAHATGLWSVTAVEWLFLFSGGLTAAYLLKIYVAVFWQKAPADASYENRRWGTPLTVAALVLAALALPALGLLPHGLAEKISGLTLSFTGGHPFAHAVSYFSLENLKGVGISLAIGLLVYFLFIRRSLMKKESGAPVYQEIWPVWLSLENSVYRPFFSFLIRLLIPICHFFCDLLDMLVLLVRKTLLRDLKVNEDPQQYSAIVRNMARNSSYNEAELSDKVGTFQETTSRLSNSLSFALLMTCLGLCLVLIAVLTHVFG